MGRGYEGGYLPAVDMEHDRKLADGFALLFYEPPLVVQMDCFHALIISSAKASGQPNGISS
jgi:hypothetical protein